MTGPDTMKERELLLLFQKELMRREEMSERDLREEYNHLKFLDGNEQFWEYCARESKKNREDWLEDMYDEMYSDWVIYLAEHQAAENDYSKAMALVLLGIPMIQELAKTALRKLEAASFKGVLNELPDGNWDVRLADWKNSV
ncbi:MAG: hypothetical protein ACW98Y_01940 [Candidatus Thorarchaeota archaeon]|jgi:hypothetical protein